MWSEDVRNGKPMLGTMIRIVRNPAVARVAAQAGLDFIMVDMEHGSASFDVLADIATVARASGVACLVRVPELRRGAVSRALDCGADGVMVPMIDTVAQAQALAGWAKYPPLGKRGLGSIGGHTDYARVSDTPAFMQRANAGTLTIAQIESDIAVSNVEKIADVDGIDVLLVGPQDLSISLGCPGNLTHELENNAIAQVAAAARAKGKALGMHAGEALIEQWIPHGLSLIMNSLDVNMLLSGMSTIRKHFAPVIGVRHRGLRHLRHRGQTLPLS